MRTAKSNRFRLAKQQLCTNITLFSSFLCRHCTTTTWNCLISRFMEEVNTRLRFSVSFCELRYSPLEFNYWKNRQHLTGLKRVGIRAMKGEAERSHLFTPSPLSERLEQANELYLSRSVVHFLYINVLFCYLSDYFYSIYIYHCDIVTCHHLNVFICLVNW